MAHLTVAGMIFTAASVALFGVGLRCIPETRCRFRANWWSITLMWFGVVFMLTGKLGS